MADNPLIALTLGDPAGIGPEIVGRTLAEHVPDAARGFAIGPASALARGLEAYGIEVELNLIEGPEDAGFVDGVIDVLDLGHDGAQYPIGQVRAESGRAAIDAIECAAGLAMDQRIDGVATAPIHKEAIWAAGSEHLGHTEILEELTQARRATTMFLIGDAKVFFTTRHMSLRQALDALTVDRVTDAIVECWRSLKVLGHSSPRLAIAALNPHGGEHGHFGREEIDVLEPACAEARERGMDVHGPIPADSVFHQTFAGRYDAVLSHFHDQGHIAAKTFDFNGTVSVTMGMPILRTSVDHGTAFDIAGSGRADHGTMASAFSAAIRLAPQVPSMVAAYGNREGRR